MSHEIRTPMNAIIGMADLLVETSLSKEQEKYVNTYRYAGENLLSIINDILDLSKIESGQIELEETGFDLQELIERTTEIMAIPAYEKGLELGSWLSPHAPTNLMGDPTRLRQVIINLTGNALKFTEEGEVVIAVEESEVGENEAKFIFSVKDTGIGIPQDRLQTIFDSFSQVDASTARKFGGTGLGLTITKLIVKLTGDKVWVESEEGSGSIFYFTAKFGIDKQKKGKLQPDTGDLKGLRALIVDDNETNRMILNETLTGWGVDAEEVIDGFSCLTELAKAKELNRPYDLILLDFMMPNMDGFEVAEKISENHELKTPIVLITSSVGLASSKEQFEKLGVSAYMHKPVKQSELLTNISIALGRAPERVDTKKKKTEGIYANGTPLKVLLVDDNRDNRNLIVAYLKSSPHGIEIAENGQIALDKFKSSKYDIVLMDIEMPVMDGLTATQKIREWEKEKGASSTPILALTAHALKEHEEKSAKAGCDGHITKPIKKAKLLEAMNEYC